MFRKTQPAMLVAVVLLALFLATGTFAALYYIQTRPDAPAGTQTVNVEGIDFIIRVPPEKRVRLAAPAEPVITTDQAPPASDQVAQPGQGDQQPQPPPPTETPVPPPTATPTPEQVIFEDYLVQAGDTLFSIDNQRPDTTIALMAQHGIDANDLVPGTIIKLPKANPAFCPGRRTYVVLEGDTAYSIAQRFTTTVEDLRAINGLNEAYNLRIAQVICLP